MAGDVTAEAEETGEPASRGRSFEIVTAGRIVFGAGAAKDLADLGMELGRRPLLLTGLGAERAVMRIYPDVERLRDGLKGTAETPLTRLHEREHRFRLLMPGWARAAVERLEEGSWRQVSGRAGEFTARPGRYRLTR